MRYHIWHNAYVMVSLDCDMGKEEAGKNHGYPSLNYIQSH